MKLNVKYNRILHKHRYFSNAVFYHTYALLSC